MELFEVKERTPELLGQLLEVWESSVRATHLFLSEGEISKIKEYVPQAIQEVQHLIVMTGDKEKPVAAFMGVDAQRLEMLFVDDPERGRGLGKQLLQHGIATYEVREVAVNEQNPLARGFYEHMGFSVVRRSAVDEQGNPYPILYMQL